MQSDVIAGASDAPREAMSLWFREPARKWAEALPLGNGRLGAMVFGGIASERIALNESTLGSGSPVGRRAPEAAHVMPELREAVRSGDDARATRLVQKQQGPFSEAYLPVGDLLIAFDESPASVRSYRRDLDLTRAVVTTRYENAGAVCTRESFVSAPDQVIVTRLTCDRAGKLSVRVSMQTQLGFPRVHVDGHTLILHGKAPLTSPPDYRKGEVVYATDPHGEGMNFDARVRLIVQGGSIHAENDCCLTRSRPTARSRSGRIRTTKPPTRTTGTCRTWWGSFHSTM